MTHDKDIRGVHRLLLLSVATLGCGDWHDDDAPAADVIVTAERDVVVGLVTTERAFWWEGGSARLGCQQQGHASVRRQDLDAYEDGLVLTDGSEICPRTRLYPIGEYLYFGADTQSLRPSPVNVRLHTETGELQRIRYAPGDAPAFSDDAFDPGPYGAGFSIWNDTVVFYAGDGIYEVAAGDDTEIVARRVHRSQAPISGLFTPTDPSGGIYYYDVTSPSDNPFDPLGDVTLHNWDGSASETVGVFAEDALVGSGTGGDSWEGLVFSDDLAYLALLRLNDIKIFRMDLATGAVSKYTQYDGKNHRLHLVRDGALLVGELWGSGYDLGWIYEPCDEPELVARLVPESGFAVSAWLEQTPQMVTAAFDNKLVAIPEP